jgi:PIN domain nuclease of toxin-antitoxin system
MSVVCAHLMAAALMHREPNDRFLAATAIFALSADLLAAADVKFPILTAESDAAVTER